MAHSDKEDKQDDEVCLKASKKNKWYLDSGCSRHMTRNQSKFVNFSKKDGGLVTFGDNKKGKIIDEDTIVIVNDTCVGFYVLKLIGGKQKHILFSIKLLLMFIR